MNYNEGEVACYPPSSEFENDLGMVGLGMGLPCFMENDFSLMEPTSILEQTISSALSHEPSAQTEVPQLQLSSHTVPLPSPLPHHTLPLRSHNLVLSKPGILTQPAPPVACYPPTITFPFVPFWTGCPLPFDPRTYPQTVVPPSPLLTEIYSNNAKEEKISKYRQKRLKRNFNRPVDHQRSQMAEKRPRDEKGKFQEAASPSSMGKRVEQSLRAQVDELKERLALSESESRALKEKLAYMEQELRLLKLTTLQYDEQEQKPSSPERQKLSGSPPSSYGFSSTNVPCYTEKIDFSKIELRKTDSPHLEAVRKIEPLNDLLPPPTL